MYSLILCALLVMAYSAWLYYRYNRLEEATKQAYSFSKVMGVRIYKAMIVAMFAAIGISNMAINSLPIIVSTSQPAILMPQFTADNGNRIFIWSGWKENAGMVYGVRVRNVDGSSSPYNIVADEKVHVIEDETLKDTGTWTVTTHHYDTTNPLFGWTFNGDARSAWNVVKVELRLPKGAVNLLPQ